MASFRQEDSKPVDNFSEVKSGQKQEEASVGNLVTTLRTDMVPASDTQPARKSIFQQENLKVAVGILLGLVIIGLILYLSAGPGRPTLEKGLVSLVRTETTPTRYLTPSPRPATKTPPKPSNTPYLSPTIRPTNTPINEIAPSPIHIRTSTTPTSSTACREALTITLADVGQSICVQGIIIETVTNPTYFMVVFSNQPGALYWVSYDLVWSKAELDTCYQIKGTIEKIANSPVLVFNYRNFPEACP